MDGTSELIERLRDLRFSLKQYRKGVKRASRMPRPCKLRPFDHSLKSYTRRRNSHEPDFGLCKQCNSLDFLAIFCVDPDESKDRWTPTESAWHLEELLKLELPPPEESPACPLCRVFYTCAREHQPIYPWKLYLRRVDWEGSQDMSRNPICLCFTSAMLSWGFFLLAPINWSHRQPSMQSAFTPRPEYLLFQSIPYPLFVTEVQRCVDIEAQQEPLETQHPFPEGMNVIDCVLRKIVKYDGHADYLTLSYVWGPQYGQTVVIGIDGMFELTDLPVSVQDGISVTLNLGKTFLWVDRYCIDQRQPAKAAQINNMSSIFRHSWVTIVSLGHDASANLPGVSSCRQKPTLVRTSQCDLLDLSERPEVVIRSSAWNTRAWTFQEAVLSRRLLFFAPSQSFLMCNHGTIFESLTQPSHSPTPDCAGTFPESSTQLLYDTKASIFLDRFNHTAIDRYCSRDLSYEDDSLNAFRGYLEDCGRTSFWGTIAPFYEQHWNLNAPANTNHLDNGICLGMLWYKLDGKPLSTLESVQRSQLPKICERFPSWSWVSCRTNAQQLFITIADALWVASAFLDDSDGCPRPFSDAVNGRNSLLDPNGSYLIPEISKEILIRGRFLEFDLPGGNPLVERLTSKWTMSRAIENVTTSTEFYPDQRTCCSQHLNWEAEGACDSAVLVYVEDCSDKPVSGTLVIAYWLVLKKVIDLNTDDARSYWHRVGWIRMTFDHRGPGQDLFSYSADKATKALFKDVSVSFKKALMEDIDAPEHTQMVRLG